MHPSLWVSKTGLSAQDLKMATISNNLANVATTGFKRERAVFQDLLYQTKKQSGAQSSQDTTLPSGLQLGTGVRAVATQKIHSMGNIEITEQPLDIAINGRGMFQILRPDGSLAYTRDGQFSMDANGQIVNAQGYALQPAVNIPTTATTITIGTDGTISVLDGASGATSQVGNIQVTDFPNPAGLQAIGDNLYLETGSSGAATTATPGVGGVGSTVQGALENSNVNVVTELVNMIATQRAYEMNSKVVSSVDQMLQYVGQNL